MKPRDNPFRSCCVDSVGYISSDNTIEQLYEKFCRMDYIAAIIGDHGRGKTTLLNALSERLRNDSVPTRHVFINDTIPFSPASQKVFVSDLDEDCIVLVDGIDMLGLFRKGRFLRYLSKKCRGILLVSHASTSLPTLVKCETSPQLLKRLVETLLTENSMPMLDDFIIEELFQTHNGNIRNCLSQMYDIFADKETQAIKVN